VVGLGVAPQPTGGSTRISQSPMPGSSMPAISGNGFGIILFRSALRVRPRMHFINGLIGNCAFL
jgi:hypothetical protein